LTKTPAVECWPAWSPDGKRIAFLSARHNNGRCLFHECTGNAFELYVIDADGSDENRLTETTANEEYAGWTPDGEWILFSRIEDPAGDYDIHAVRADGSCEVQLTDTAAWEWSASWIGATDSLDC
jgi:Tol biopolymer transport system component